MQYTIHCTAVCSVDCLALTSSMYRVHLSYTAGGTLHVHFSLCSVVAVYTAHPCSLCAVYTAGNLQLHSTMHVHSFLVWVPLLGRHPQTPSLSGTALGPIAKFHQELSVNVRENQTTWKLGPQVMISDFILVSIFEIRLYNLES